jgi:hypothetical protein
MKPKKQLTRAAPLPNDLQEAQRQFLHAIQFRRRRNAEGLRIGVSSHEVHLGEKSCRADERIKLTGSFVVCGDQAFLRAEFDDGIIYVVMREENGDQIARLLRETFSGPVPVIVLS